MDGEELSELIDDIRIRVSALYIYIDDGEPINILKTSQAIRNDLDKLDSIMGKRWVADE